LRIYAGTGYEFYIYFTGYLGEAGAFNGIAEANIGNVNITSGGKAECELIRELYLGWAAEYS
jgi:hypothetical protein